MSDRLRAAVLRCRKAPRFVTWEVPDFEIYFGDDRQLVAALEVRGVEADLVGWDDPSIDWTTFDFAIIRSTWDYIDERDRFLSVLAGIDASGCRLFNSLEAVRWNTEKSYLFDLAERRVPIVPTIRVAAASPAAVEKVIAERGWSRVILKPAVGAGGANVVAVAAREVSSALEQWLADARGAGSGSSAGSSCLVQPFVESIGSEGEWSFVYMGGELSHVLLKKPAAGDYRTHGNYGGSISRAEPTPRDLALAEAILAKMPHDVLYARLDLVRVGEDLAVMEVELVEPMLYFGLAPEAADRLAAATLAKLAALRGQR